VQDHYESPDRILFLALLLVAALVCVGGAFWIHRGFRARSTPAASEAYLARKIRNSCHGLDGSARTPLGENLYPRVPDLRAAHTQGLSDGELHYIIENGVELTGMSAFTDLHEGSPRGGLASSPLRPQPGCTESSVQESAGRREFAGSLRRLTSLRQVPLGNLRAMEEDTHGERDTRSARASRRYHPPI
jgi:hypothetical protein